MQKQNECAFILTCVYILKSYVSKGKFAFFVLVDLIDAPGFHVDKSLTVMCTHKT